VNVRPTRILLAKVGLDGHDRGVRMIAMELQRRGAEVILLGTGTTPAVLARAAVQEDADVIGISILSGAHLTLVPKVLAELAGCDLVNVPVLCGGTIPVEDQIALKRAGVHAVLPVGTTVTDAAEALISAAAAAAGRG
jgi:methylmalonyl-CoA mutase C-terminal domain/subunit